MRFTIKEIAKEAAVSVKTVSRVINDDPLVSDRTRIKVQGVMEKLGYRPNLLARSLRKKSTKFIGFIIPNTTNPSFTEFVRGSTEVFDLHGYHVIMCSSDDNERKENQIIKDLKAMWIAGMLLIPSYTENRDMGVFESILFPTVVVDREIPGLKRDLVVINNTEGACQAVRYLVQNGHRRIVILAGVKSIRNCVERYLGWETAMKESNLFDKDLIFWDTTSVSIDSGYRMMQAALEKVGVVDAVFACSDIVAIGAMQAIEEKGYRIPQDLSIVGFDDIAVSEYLKPPLTTVHNPMYEMGKKAATVLVKRIKDTPDFEPEKHVIECALKIRGSVEKGKKYD